jgi:hypothetical protein
VWTPAAAPRSGTGEVVLLLLGPWDRVLAIGCKEMRSDAPVALQSKGYRSRRWGALELQQLLPVGLGEFGALLLQLDAVRLLGLSFECDKSPGTDRLTGW